MKKKTVFRRTAMAIAVSTVFVLSACGGGGGGGGGYTKPDSPTQYYSSGTLANYGFTAGSRSQVPFSTPTLVSTFNPYAGSSTTANVSQQYITPNLTGDGGQDMIVTGRMSQPATPGSWVNSNIQLFDWQSGNFVNDTAKWFPGGINSILGTDPTVQFADFFHSGHTDMLVAPSTDMNYYGPNGSQVLLFKNNGNQFGLTTINLPNIWAHGVAIADLTGSGYQDVIIPDYGVNTTLLMNNHVNGFTAYTNAVNGPGNDLVTGGSSATAADFMGNGSTQIVLTDNACHAHAVCNTSSTIMYSWSIDPATKQASFGFIKELPVPIFDQAPYAIPGLTSHNYLIINKDFLGNGIQDLIVFSQPGISSVKMSAIQFLQNDGHGNFTDVTNTMLVGYNMNTYGTYHPQFINLGNGQESMIVSGADYSGTNNSTQILIKQSASGPYVAAFQNLISNFASEANLIANSQNNSNQVAVVKDPSNNLYLVTTLQYQASGRQMMSTYLSLIGPSVSTTTAQAAFNQVKATWPWMSPAQVNQVLASTSSSYMTDAGTGLVLNPNNLMNPVGAMSVATRSGAMTLSGGISGVSLGSINQLQAFDSLGRNYTVNFSNNNYTGPNSFNTNTEHIDQYNMTSHTEYLLNGTTNTVYSPVGAMRLGYENRTPFNTMGAPMAPREFGDQSGNQGLYLGMTQPKQWSFGLPEMYRNGNFYTGIQYTSLNTNPWVNFTGAFGSVSNSGTIEQVATYSQNGFSMQGAVMRTTTNFRSGMVTNVSPITAAWAETGYRYTGDGFGDLGMYLGVKPVVLNGSVTATMPTGVDNAGNTVYTANKMGIVSNTTPYLRVLYTGVIDRNNGYRLSGMTTQDGFYRAMAEYRYTFN